MPYYRITAQSPDPALQRVLDSYVSKIIESKGAAKARRKALACEELFGDMVNVHISSPKKYDVERVDPIQIRR